MIAGQTEGKIVAQAPIIGKGVRLRTVLSGGVPFEVTLSTEDFVKYKLPRPSDLVGRRIRITLEIED